MKKTSQILAIGFLFLILTILTQIGGVVLLLSLLLGKKWKLKSKWKPYVSFFGLYLIVTLLIVPFLAPLFGRERIKNTDKIKPANYVSLFLNRNYVKPELNQLLLNVSNRLNKTGVAIRYLDANFPFINKFPLLPHLSHNDGKKLDISLVYENKNGEIANKNKSISGYGVFEAPKKGEFNQTVL